MKTTIIATTTLAATALAAAAPSSVSTAQCPKNTAQPNGNLPLLATEYVSPSLLLEISAKEPNKKFSPSNTAEVTPGDKCTIFNLDLPVKEAKNKVCNLVFDLPANPLANTPLASTVDFTFDGPGSFKFIGYDIGVGAVAGETTYANQPKSGPSPPSPPPKMLPGNSYVINAAPCDFPANLTSVKVSGALCSDDTHLRYDQGYLGTCPIGFYVVFTDAKK